MSGCDERCCKSQRLCERLAWVLLVAVAQRESNEPMFGQRSAPEDTSEQTPSDFGDRETANSIPNPSLGSWADSANTGRFRGLCTCAMQSARGAEAASKGWGFEGSRRITMRSRRRIEFLREEGGAMICVRGLFWGLSCPDAAALAPGGGVGPIVPLAQVHLGGHLRRLCPLSGLISCVI